MTKQVPSSEPVSYPLTPHFFFLRYNGTRPSKILQRLSTFFFSKAYYYVYLLLRVNYIFKMYEYKNYKITFI